MKKILIVINTLGQAGAETALLELLRNIDPKEYEVSLYVLMAQGEMIKYVPKHVKILNSRYDDCSVLSSEGKKHLKKHVMRTLLKRGTIFRMAPYMISNLCTMIRKKDIRKDKLLWRAMACGADRLRGHYDLAVGYLEGGATYYIADYVDADKKAAFVHVDYVRAGYGRKLDRECYLKLDKIFAVSDEVKESFLNIYPECGDRTEVFHNLINQEMIRTRAGLPGGFTDSFDGQRILTVGRLTSQKSFEISIEAMKILKDAGENVRWYILGEGEKRAELEAKIKELELTDDFLLPGAAENPYPYMAQADIYVHATRFEGKSIAIQEAQTLGCAIIVSDCSGNREQVIDNEDGLLCDFTPEKIAEAIKSLLYDEKKREFLGMAAARKKISDTNEVRKLLDLMV